ncbi:coiled-coil domain-containing protein [Tropilaelaps mercedesae]|uniref:Coiled-coil domain-containing protein n=1 Tax=Tropilaelaps mercedesae TaxID=418985 RepID=A0A1V9X017_9ACAR|nr:coiled-coil domain-containing protein [Tropilaelaps mercedesae]
MYYTTPVYKFRMKCHLCNNYIEMQTDPGNLDYKILSGASRQERRWDPTQNGQVVPEDKVVAKQLASDPMFKLDHAREDAKKMKHLEPVISNLERFQGRKEDDYELNSMLRKKFRKEKKERKQLKEKDVLLKSKAALNIKLLPESTYDQELAQMLRLEAPMSADQKWKRDRDDLMSRSIFEQTESSSMTKRSTRFERQILHCTTPAKRNAQSTSDSLRQAVKKAPKRLFGFDDIIALPSCKTLKKTVDGANDKQETAADKDECADGDALQASVVHKGNACAQQNLASQVQLLPSMESSQVDHKQTKASTNCSKYNTTTLIVYSDSDQDDTD